MLPPTAYAYASPQIFIRIKNADPRVRFFMADWNRHAQFCPPSPLLVPNNKALRYNGPVCVRLLGYQSR